MSCVICSTETESPSEFVCGRCGRKAAQHLHAVLATWHKAHGELLPNASGGGSSSSEPKIGVNVAALSWINGAPILNILHSWEQLIREERKLAKVGTIDPKSIQHTITDTVRFHLAHLDWSLDQPWAEDYLREIADLAAEGRAACRETETIGTRIGCPGETEDGETCGQRLTLPADPTEHVRCRRCGTEWDQRRLAAVAMSTHDIEVMVSIAEVAHHTGLSEATLRRWIKAGHIQKHGKRVNLKEVRDAIRDKIAKP